MPKATRVQRARVDTEVRALADQVCDGMGPPWGTASGRPRSHGCPTWATGSTGPSRHRPGCDEIPVWAGLVRVLQWLLIISAVVGAGWLALLAFGSYARLPEPPTPELGDFPVPTLMLLGGIALGVLLALVCRLLVSMTARAGRGGRQAAA